MIQYVYIAIIVKIYVKLQLQYVHKLSHESALYKG